LGRRTIAPFADAGATVRHFETGRDLDAAITVGSGLRWRVSVVNIIPEIRFLRWTSDYYQPVQNQAMFVLSITYPPR